MTTNGTPPRSCRWGASLIELLVVIAIVAILTSLTLVAIQYSREGARRASCQNNLRQLSLAMRSYVETRGRFPDPALAGQAGGWVVELMPFLEESALQDSFKAQPALEGPNASPLVRKRIPLLTCAGAIDVDSNLPGIPAAHYVVQPPETRHRKNLNWTFGDAAIDCRLPWIAGPERNIKTRVNGEHSKTGPHSGGFLAIDSRHESCYFHMPE